MKEFSELIDIAKVLNSPGGCPWDLEQTFASLRPYVLEEAHEVLEAVDEGKDQELIEELGDLFYTVIFYTKVAEREKKFSIKEVIERLKAKLIHRHPHVFGDKKAASMEEVINHWEQAKKDEKVERTTPLDGIPKTLPLLQMAHKILGRMRRHNCPLKKHTPENRSEELAEKILEIVVQAENEDIDIESAFREALGRQKTHFLLQKA